MPRHRIIFVLLAGLLVQGALAEPVFRVPFHLVDSQVHVRAKVNGKPATLILDTGANISAFDSKLVGIAHDGSVIVTPGGERAAPVGDADCQIGELKFTVQAAFLDHLPYDGIIGMDVFKTYRSVTFDFVANELILVK